MLYLRNPGAETLVLPSQRSVAILKLLADCRMLNWMVRAEAPGDHIVTA